MRYVPIAFITGQTGKNVKALLNHAQMLFKQSRQRVTHGPAQPPAARRGAAQPAAAVPESPAEDLLRHAGGRAAADDRAVLQRAARRSRRPYQRYLLGALRDQLNFDEVPIKLYLRRRQPSDSRDDVEASWPRRERRRRRSAGRVITSRAPVGEL